jgi:N-acetylglutamate synthase-like GNAT family acetyltransferase
MTELPKTFQYRQANQYDGTGICSVLEEAAPEIQISLDTEEVQGRMITEILQCVRSGKSLVAVDESGQIVGVALARPDFHEHGAISLRYLAVSKDSRRNGVSSSLMEKLKANAVPLTTSVLDNNLSGMAERLPKSGFTKVKSVGNETQFRWDPPKAEKTEAGGS